MRKSREPADVPGVRRCVANTAQFFILSKRAKRVFTYVSICYMIKTDKGRANKMTLKEMIKKVNTYNEVAKVLGEKEIVLKMKERFGINITFETYAEIKKAVNEEYSDWAVNAVLNYDGYELNDTKEITVNTPFGDTTTISLEIMAYDK